MYHDRFERVANVYLDHERLKSHSGNYACINGERMIDDVSEKQPSLQIDIKPLTENWCYKNTKVFNIHVLTTTGTRSLNYVTTQDSSLC